MTGVDWLWVVATVLFVGGVLALGWVAWQVRSRSEDRYGAFVKIDMGVNGTVTGPAEALRHFTIRRRPFDWSRHEGL